MGERPEEERRFQQFSEELLDQDDIEKKINKEIFSEILIRAESESRREKLLEIIDNIESKKFSNLKPILSEMKPVDIAEIINDVDEDIINSVSYSYDYASGDKYRHTRLEIANIPINGGSPDDGNVIKTLTERTARMWGLVEETFGPYFSMDITTTVNGLTSNDFSVSVLFQKPINP